MSFQINTNLGALQAYQALSKLNANTAQANLRLATQKRINSVADDTSGYRVGKELQGQVSIMKAAQGNIGAAKDMLATAESALSNINDLLIQIQGKVADANDPTKNLDALANDIKALGSEISSIFTNTKFNSTELLSGSSVPASFTFQTGVGETTDVKFGTLNAIDLSSISGASSANVASIDVSSIQSTVRDALGSIGNFTQRLNVKSDYLDAAVTNATASISRLFDANVAMEQLNSTKGQIGGQIATSALYQLNIQPQSVLALFR
jgi:flagellin